MSDGSTVNEVSNVTEQSNVSDTEKRIAVGEKVVIAFCASSAVLGSLPFLTGPMLLVNDYVLFLAVKRAMDAPFDMKDVMSLVAPTLKATFAFSLFKTVADAFGWSWWVTIPAGALVSAATTYALGMCFVHFNAREGRMTAAEAASTMKAAAVDYIETKAKASPKVVGRAKQALDRMFTTTLCDQGHKNHPGAKFCAECGQKLEQKA